MEQFDFEKNGFLFRCIVLHDTDLVFPWNEHDGYGFIRTVYSYCGTPEKRPGERIIYSKRGDHWIYDVQWTMKIARRDGWSCKEVTPNMTAGQKAVCSVEADIQYIREWLEGNRFWAMIEVFRVDDEGEKVGESEYLGGIDNGYSREDDDYLKQCAGELADELIRQSRAAKYAGDTVGV